MKPISRINQSDDMPDWADAIGRETNSGGHIVYLDRRLSRFGKRLSLRTIMRVIGVSHARQDAVLLGFAAWKADGKAKTATTTAVVAVAAGGVATLIALGGHHDGHEAPLQRPRLSMPAGPLRPFSKPPAAPRATATGARSPRVSVTHTHVRYRPADVLSYGRAQSAAPDASPSPSVPVPLSPQPSPQPGAPSTPPPAAPTPPAGVSASTPPRPAEGGVCVDIRPIVYVCVG